MIHLSKSLAMALVLVVSIAAQAQTPDEPSTLTEAQKQSRIRLDTAPIKTREDLVRYLANGDPSNPLNALSAEARARLLQSVVVNQKGEIASFWIDDIRTELTPTDAYKVFSLFGLPELAGKNNNGRVNSTTDANVKSSTSTLKPALEGYYCNGGYCTENEQLTCIEGRCIPPR
jgi:hypothetical protein